MSVWTIWENPLISLITIVQQQAYTDKTLHMASATVVVWLQQVVLFNIGLLELNTAGISSPGHTMDLTVSLKRAIQSAYFYSRY